MTQTEILRACTHRDKATCEVSRTREHEALMVCVDCWNAGVYARRAERKAQLAARPKDCERCRRKPSAWNYGGIKLCSPCKKLTEAEHYKATAGFGILALTVHRPMVDSSGWAVPQASQE